MADEEKKETETETETETEKQTKESPASSTTSLSSLSSTSSSRTDLIPELFGSDSEDDEIQPASQEQEPPTKQPSYQELFGSEPDEADEEGDHTRKRAVPPPAVKKTAA